MARRDLRLDLVSPLPPVRSGIADYCLDLLPHLAGLCDLRLVGLPEQPVGEEIAEEYGVVEAERLGEDGRLPLYQMGNNAYHLAVEDLARERPGVLTLHDLVLHHLLAERTLKHQDTEGYRRELAAEHGWIGDAAARPRRWPGGWSDAALFALPAHRRLLASQRGVIVHSPWAAEWLAEELPGLAVEAVSMGVPPGRAADDAAGRAFRKRRGMPVDAPLLGSFGFQTPIKRTDVVIRALASPRLAKAHLMVAGEMAPESALEETARDAGVADRVHCLGFLPFEELDEAIAAADLCVNLRYPTAGETSASLLRILAVGRPVIVSDHAQSSDLSDDVVVKTPVGEGEREVLVERLGELLADRPRLEAMGEAARRHVVEHHAPADAAVAIVEACERFRERTPLAIAVDVLPKAPRPTSLAWESMTGELEVRGAEAPWPAGERRRLEIRLTNESAARWLAGERSEGGVALAVSVRGAEGESLVEPPWLSLPVDLEPGEEHRFALELRRPLGKARLRIEPHVFGDRGFGELGGPIWEEEI